MRNEELKEKLEAGAVRVKLINETELFQFTRNKTSADTCPCTPLNKRCTLLAEFEWDDVMIQYDKDGRVGAWDIGNQKMTSITSEEIIKVIGV